MNESQRQLVLNSMETIDFHIRLAALRYPKLRRDDVRSELYLQTCKTAERFNPARGLVFKTMLGHRLIGTLKDMVRKNMGGRSSKGKEYKSAIKISAQEYADYIPDGILNEDQFNASLDYQLLCGRLNKRERIILDLELVGLSQDEIGAKIGIRGPRVSQLRTRIFERLTAHA